MFFIQDNQLLTPPLERVLPGVTRQRIIQTALDIGIPVIETLIPANNISSFQGAFISGTSPKILPIASIGDLNLSSAKLPLVRNLMVAFDLVILNDLSEFKQQAETLILKF